MRAFGWKGGEDGCGYYRVEQPLAELAKRGHETHAAVIWEPGPWRDIDTVIGQRICLPGPSKLWKQADDVLRVFEVDDDLFNVDPSSPAYALFGKPEIQLQLRQNIYMSDRVTCSTPYLAERLTRIHKDVRIIPNCVPDYVFTMPRPRRKKFTFGWAGSWTHHMDWAVAEAEVKQFLDYHQDVAFRTIGHDYLPEHAEHTPWIAHTEALYPELTFHVGLAPLADHRFNLSKSHIKAVEYGARGIPVIASDVGPYSRYIVHGENGFLVRRPGDWGFYMNEIMKPTVYGPMVVHAQAYARRYSASRFAPAWENALTR